MDDNMNGMTIWNVYQESLWRIKNGVDDYRDIVLVKMFKDGLEQDKLIDDLKKQLRTKHKDLEKRIGEQEFALDILHSRENVSIEGRMNVAEYMQSLLDKPVSSAVH